MRARSGLALDLPDRRGHRGRGHDARRICLVPEHFAPIATFRAHEAGAGKAAARTRGEATKRNACATSVAPGVPKGRALGPLAVVTRARRTAEPHAPLHDHVYWSRLRLNSVVTDLRLLWIQGGGSGQYISQLFGSTDVLQLGWNCRLHLKIRPQWLKFKKMLILVGLELLSSVVNLCSPYPR